MNEVKEIHMSKSQLLELINTPMHYKYNRIDRVPKLPGVYASKGQAFHHTMKRYFDRVKEDGCKHTELELRAIATRYFVREWSSRVEYKKPLSHLKKYGLIDDPKGMAKLRGIYHAELMDSISAVYQYLEKIKPVAVELPYTLNIADGRGGKLLLKVIVDLLCVYNHEVTTIEEYEVENILKSGKLGVPKKMKREVKTGETVLIESLDWKLSGKAKTQRDCDTDIGLILSAVVMQMETGKLPENVALFNVVTSTSAKRREVTSKINVVTTKITVEDCNVMIRRVQAGLNMIFLGCYPPCAESFKCGQECDYWETCEYVFRKGLDENALAD